jgi:hypothetical protein
MVTGQAPPFRVTEEILIKYGFQPETGNWIKVGPQFNPRADLRSACRYLLYSYNVTQESHTLVEGTGEDFPYAPDTVWLPRPNSEAEFLATLRALKFINL